MLPANLAADLFAMRCDKPLGALDDPPEEKTRTRPASQYTRRGENLASARDPPPLVWQHLSAALPL